MNIPVSAHGKEDSSGFTLVEVLVAFALFMIGMASVVTLSIQAARLGESSRNRLEALHQARAQMEELMRMDFDDPAMSPGFYPVVRGDTSGSYTITHRETGQTKTAVVVMQYPSFRHVATVELEGVISRALH
jgi:Tfp pilus assembly protein PilV